MIYYSTIYNQHKEIKITSHSSLYLDNINTSIVIVLRCKLPLQAVVIDELLDVIVFCIQASYYFFLSPQY